MPFAIRTETAAYPAQDFHDHHSLAQATLHVHLDHDSCLEVTVLKGPCSEVKAFANTSLRSVA
jgi:metal-responsive CopG/Arc/MetJ family transcriptional regulator